MFFLAIQLDKILANYTIPTAKTGWRLQLRSNLELWTLCCKNIHY